MLLPPSVQVCPVEIPGRGRREGEPAPSDAAELAHVLARLLPLQVITIFASNITLSIISNRSQ